MWKKLGLALAFLLLLAGGAFSQTIYPHFITADATSGAPIMLAGAAIFPATPNAATSCLAIYNAALLADKAAGNKVYEIRTENAAWSMIPDNPVWPAGRDILCSSGAALDITGCAAAVYFTSIPDADNVVKLKYIGTTSGIVRDTVTGTKVSFSTNSIVTVSAPFAWARLTGSGTYDGTDKWEISSW